MDSYSIANWTPGPNPIEQPFIVNEVSLKSVQWPECLLYMFIYRISGFKCDVKGLRFSK